ncbi:hypothetical protein CPZ13_01530 [Lacticaseibacillus paracasei]|nr:hypothetical protein [Lacticaseibacillus paracasei]PCL24706.1 hypothetical protein CPZ14_01540 [Lacticaseibacillus paracasei]PCL35512.1 hypothetical protein CPZ13_01530 [Lacticaseibacillus paracasei]RDV41757.1 hypothetical protein DQM07_06050 [Lacticaseibacillus paracasei subsp. paracasei]
MPAQKPAHKGLKPNLDKAQPFRLEATYAPVSKRAGSRSKKKTVCRPFSSINDAFRGYELLSHVMRAGSRALPDELGRDG